MTPPMADPMQPPLPANPRPNPGVQAPMTPAVAQQQNTMNSLLGDKVQSESGDDGMTAQGGGMGDMTAATMGMGGKLASDRALIAAYDHRYGIENAVKAARVLALIGPDPKTGFGKSAAPFHPFFDTVDRGEPIGGETSLGKAPPPAAPPKPSLLNRPWMVQAHEGTPASTWLGRMGQRLKGVGTDLSAGLGLRNKEIAEASDVHQKALISARAARSTEKSTVKLDRKFGSPEVHKATGFKPEASDLKNMQTARYQHMARSWNDPMHHQIFNSHGADPNPLRARVFNVDAVRSLKRLLTNMQASKARGRGMLLGGAAGLVGGAAGYGVGDALKQAAQADDGSHQPVRSAVGESKGLSFRHNPGDYAKGHDAWASISNHFKGGRRVKVQPNPFKGDHAGVKEASSIVGNLLGNILSSRDQQTLLGTTGLGALVGGGIGGLYGLTRPKGERDVMSRVGKGAVIGGGAGLGAGSLGLLGGIGGSYGGDTASALGAGAGLGLGGVLGGQLAAKATKTDDEKTAGLLGGLGRLLGRGAAPAAAKAPRTMGTGTLPSALHGTPRGMPPSGASQGSGTVDYRGAAAAKPAPATATGGTTSGAGPATEMDPLAKIQRQWPQLGQWLRTGKRSWSAGGLAGVGATGLAGKELAAADLTPFAEGFFAQCEAQGVDPAQAVEKVGSEYGDEAVQELRDGLEKLAGPMGFLGRQAGKLLGGGSGGPQSNVGAMLQARRGFSAVSNVGKPDMRVLPSSAPLPHPAYRLSTGGHYSAATNQARAKTPIGSNIYRHEVMHGLTHEARRNPELAASLPPLARASVRLGQMQSPFARDMGRHMDELNAHMSGARTPLGKAYGGAKYLFNTPPAYVGHMNTRLGKAVVGAGRPLAYTAGLGGIGGGSFLATNAMMPKKGSDDVEKLAAFPNMGSLRAGAQRVGGWLGMTPKPVPLPAGAGSAGRAYAPGAASHYTPPIGATPRPQTYAPGSGSRWNPPGMQPTQPLDASWKGFVGQQAGGSAAGALAGGFGGHNTPMDTGSTAGNALAGAVAFNPWLNRAAGGSGARALLNAPLRAYQGGTVGAIGGGGLDFLAQLGGMQGTTGPDGQHIPSTNFARMGGMLGTGFGGIGGSGRALRNLAPVGSGMQRAGTKMMQFGEGALAPMMPGRNIVGLPRMLTGTPAAASRAGSMGRKTAYGLSGVLGANQMMHGFKQEMGVAGRDMADAYLGERMPQMLDTAGQHATGVADQWLQQRGLLGEDGQINVAGPAMERVTGGIDGLFRGMGMDPSRMSPLQKMMILGGAGVGAGGMAAGSPGLAAMGGLGALAGFVPGMGQRSGPGGHAGGPGGVPHGATAPPPNTATARNEWDVQRQLQR